MKDKFCIVCKCKIYSKTKQRPVLCECQYKQLENIRTNGDEIKW